MNVEVDYSEPKVICLTIPIKGHDVEFIVGVTEHLHPNDMSVSVDDPVVLITPMCPTTPGALKVKTER